ncbi:hypothetical protein E2C01_081843 [Portunus trituberculatus]|uniref:Uncharacterized protein n=1 Tax=Portunus trituberculatus TaxID=210409 RepID=A0A5B7IWY6_PORTR|nr:hypothetical protein [Portunus trituberculatus]
MIALRQDAESTFTDFLRCTHADQLEDKVNIRKRDTTWEESFRVAMGDGKGGENSDERQRNKMTDVCDLLDA